MKIAAIGRGNVGGGLARLWRAAGHDVTEIGREGGDVSDADVLLVAVPPESITRGPVAKSFNLNFAVLYDRIAAEDVPPSNLYAADEEARGVTEQLIRDAGYEPVYAGDLGQARALEEMLSVLMAVNRAGLGAHFYRFYAP